MNKNIIVGLVIGLLFIMAGTGMISVVDGADTPLFIDENSDFASLASSGDGSVGNPYLISDMSFVTYGGSAIEIVDTTVYCVFDNITITGDSSGYGINMHNVSNVNFTGGMVWNQMNGILIYNCSNVIIDGMDIQGEGDYGVFIDVSDNVAVMNCDISDVGDGVRLWNSFRVGIWNNTFVSTGVSFYGTCQVSTGVSVTGNEVNGKPLGYLYNDHDRVINVSTFGQLILVSCVNVTLHHGNISNTNYGVQFIFCMNSNIALSNITNNDVGILVYESSYCRVYGNNITDNTHGLFGYFALGTIVYENNVFDNVGYGTWLWYGCSSSSLYLNNFIDNYLSNARDDGGREDSSLTWVAAKFTNSISDRPLSNVNVTVERAGRTFTAYTNENGLIKLPVPSFGTYDFTIEKFRYQTKTPSVTITQPGVHLFEVAMDKADLGPGTGYVQARFMDGNSTIEGATVKVYSYLDGAYYYHSQYTSNTGGDFPGWVEITGLYYDDYFFQITHPDYDDKIINQIVLPDNGDDITYPYIGRYSDIQLTPIYEPRTDCYVVVNVKNATSGLPMEGANVSLKLNGIVVSTTQTDINGNTNITDLVEGFYSVNVSYSGHDNYVSLVDIGFDTSLSVFLTKTIEYEYIHMAYRVFDSSSGLPVEGAKVSLLNGPVRLTNVSGYANMSGTLRVSSPYSVEITHDIYEIYYDVIDLSVETYREVNITLRDTVVILVNEEFSGGDALVDANVTLTDGAEQRFSMLTNVSGYVSMVDLEVGVYQIEVTKSGYDTFYGSINMSESYYKVIYMEETVSPEGSEGEVNQYDSGVEGNYWDDLGGVLVLAEEGVIYEVSGDNPDNPIDSLPLDEPYVPSYEGIPNYVRFQPKHMEQNRHIIHTYVELKWKAMWNDTDVEITEGAQIYLNTGQQLEFRDGYWCANVTSNEVGIVAYYIGYMIVDEVEIFEPDIGFTLTWENIIETTTTITTETTTITDIAPVDITGVLLISFVGIGVIILAVRLGMRKEQESCL